MLSDCNTPDKLANIFLMNTIKITKFNNWLFKINKKLDNLLINYHKQKRKKGLLSKKDNENINQICYWKDFNG